MILGIYEISFSSGVWDIPNMLDKEARKSRAEASAALIAKRLEAFPHSVSERQWTKDASVSPSFFSNLRGTPTHPPSDPSVDQLRRVLEVQGITLAEFFAVESEGRVIVAPTQQAVELALSDALEALPPKKADRPAYLAEAVAKLLALPASLPTTPTTPTSELNSTSDDSEEDAPPRAATKKR